MDKVSRAYHKMKEVFTRIDCLRLADTAQWTAIDVGAAPGGWYTPPKPPSPTLTLTRVVRVACVASCHAGRST